MARWQPDAEGRLSDAALELYAERGFDQTTVADIAERAGLTARTFFNHFADKRDVLFSGTAVLRAEMERALEAASDATSPMAAVVDVVIAAAGVISGDRDHSRRRREVILANVQLLERELLKLEALTTVLADGLRAQGVDEVEARVAAEVGITAFKVAFDLWVTGDDDGPSMEDRVREVLRRIDEVTARR